MDKIYDKESGPELAKHLRSLLTQCSRALESKLTDDEIKLLTTTNKSASDILRNYDEEYFKEKNYDESLKKVDQQLLTASSKHAFNEISVAKLRTEFDAKKFALEMSQAKIEKLSSLRRTKAVEANKISTENHRISQNIEEKKTYWKLNSLKLGEFKNKLDIVCDNSPKMKNTNKERQFITELRDRLCLLENQENELLDRKRLLEHKINGYRTDDLEMIVTNIDKLFSTYEKCCAHYTEKEEIIKKLLGSKESRKDAMEMSLADLNDTQVLLKVVDYEEEEENESISSEEQTPASPAPSTPIPSQETTPSERSREPPAPKKFVSQPEPRIAIKQPQVVTSNSQKDGNNNPSISCNSHLINIDSQLTNLSQNKPTQEIINESIIEDVESQPIDEPMAEEYEPEEFAAVDSQVDNEVLIEDENLNNSRDNALFDTETVLNISQNSNDPGADFLSMMQSADGDREKSQNDFSFNFATNFETDVDAVGNGGDSFNFGAEFDFNNAGGGQESSFNFNFDSAPSQENNGEESNFFFNF